MYFLDIEAEITPPKNDPTTPPTNIPIGPPTTPKAIPNSAPPNPEAAPIAVFKPNFKAS